MATVADQQVWRSCQHFSEWVQQNLEQGIDGTGEQKPYVPYSKLEYYWTHSRVANILGPYDRDVDIDSIRSRFLQVLSILASITGPSNRRTEYLVLFYKANIDDGSLPLRSPNRDRTSNSIQSFQGIPAPFHDTLDAYQVSQQFAEFQWKFLPLQFKPSEGIIDRIYPPRALDPRHIIPVTIISELSKQSNGGARVLKVEPHKTSGFPPDPIVFKEYRKGKYGDEFMKERNTYITIRNMRRTATIDVFEYFLRYHGCFVQGDKSVLLIEYASEGSLLDFFRKNWYLPRNEAEAQDLWNDLSQLCKGLALLHNGGKNNSSIHQDIKPANIFVCESPKGSGRFCFKFGDFGMCSVTPVTEDGGNNNGGTKMYSAPELCGTDSKILMTDRISWPADIWSFGCVLLDCAVWMALHERGRIDFRKERVQATRHLTSLCNAGFSGAFHDGERILSTIQNKADEIGEIDSPVGRLSCWMMEFIQRELLRTDNVERLNAQQLQTRFQSAILGRSAQNPVSPSIVSRPSSFAQFQTPQPRRASSNLAIGRNAIGIHDGSREECACQRAPQESAAVVSVASVFDDRAASQNGFESVPVSRSSTAAHQEAFHRPISFSSELTASASRKSPELSLPNGSAMAAGPSQVSHHGKVEDYTVNKVLDWIPRHKSRKEPMPGWLEQALKKLCGRDQVFIFDNSTSMQPYWADVKQTAEALTYILKGVDPDGFEIRMTNPGISIKRRNREGLFGHDEHFDRHRPRPDSGACAMENVLSEVLESALKKFIAPSSMFNRLKHRQIEGVSVYVFTNGVWEGRRREGPHEEAGGVENAIKTAVERLQKANRMRPSLSIQFIRFGDDINGARRMRWLDNGIKAITGGWDVVDTTLHTGKVEKMIIGAISDFVDNMPDSDAEPGVSHG
ncbi:kinase-like domain-containing protein [Xylariaceae sp. FL1651]|nr:kinase-like domain-containing protein [Xylariaceae sp. FL1651]